MFGNISSGTSSSEDGFLALLSLLNDKGALAQRFQELNKANSETQEAIQKNQQIQQQNREILGRIEEEKSLLEQAKKDHQSLVQSNIDEIKEQKILLERRRSELENGVTHNNAFAADLSNQKRLLEDLQRSLNVKEATLVSKAEELNSRELKLRESETNHKKRLAVLQEMLGS